MNREIKKESQSICNNILNLYSQLQEVNCKKEDDELYKHILAIRLGENFKQEKIENIKVADLRIFLNGESNKVCETDYIFIYDGKYYRTNEFIKKTKNGRLIKPIRFQHEVICID